MWWCASGGVPAGKTGGACPAPDEGQQGHDQNNTRGGCSSCPSTRVVNTVPCSHCAPAVTCSCPGSHSAGSEPTTDDIEGPALHAGYAGLHQIATASSTTGNSACVTRGASCQPNCGREGMAAEGGHRPPSRASLDALQPLEPCELLDRTYVALKLEAETEAGKHLCASH